MIESRIRWMDEVGIHQWNDSDYLKFYPLTYFEEYYDSLGYVVCGECYEGNYHGVLLQKNIHI